ncbi:hypothetical protein CMV_027197 [Castanea mollissima]|uniref:Protein kinase domain-containing protein n=1 Tax=Castanea mollissima TaxID=60419 RepID=A0A8J4QAQ4_9ROSI|nr:hypothetical protein CMV_027197 [Castanea mollissima]
MGFVDVGQWVKIGDGVVGFVVGQFRVIDNGVGQWVSWMWIDGFCGCGGFRCLQQQQQRQQYSSFHCRAELDMADDKEISGPVVDGNDPTGHIISTTIGGKNGEPKQTISYMAERVVGTGSFGIVFQAKCLETGETVAIKKVLQDKRYKNRELQLMRVMDHPNVISLKHCFFSTTSKNELFLNLVMEYVPETMYRVLKHYSNANQRMPLIYVKLYMYQIFRGLAYVHTVPGVCHRDLKPQNILVDPLTHQVKLCDFGSAKMLVC